MQLPLAAKVLSLSLREDEIEVVRSVTGGRGPPAKASPPRRPLSSSMARRRPSYPPIASSASRTRKISVAASPLALIGERTLAPADISLGEAEVVVAGGRGVGGPEGFRLVEELAGQLNGAVGASRVAVDLGWAPRSAQVGMTGQTVNPRLYFACGISGAVHHTLGMKDAGFIVAVDRDARAPIMGMANVGIVGDAQPILTELISVLRARAGEPAANRGAVA